MALNIVFALSAKLTIGCWLLVGLFCTAGFAVTPLALQDETATAAEPAEAETAQSQPTPGKRVVRRVTGKSTPLSHLAVDADQL